MKQNLIAVYGSLRKDEYNYIRFLNEYGDREFSIIKENINIKGYNLYDLGPYPAICKGEGSLTVDILRVSPYVLQSLDQMEIGAGYTKETTNVEGFGEVIIYTFPENSFPEARQVKSGNWSEFLKTKK